MEFAFWNNKKISAMQIAEDYELEKEIRDASRQQKLCCPDPECKQPVLRYCHGEVKGPYFAHKNNADCDYAQFDKNSPDEIRNVRKELFKHFSNAGYKVKMEEKVLPHHYTQLLFTDENGQQTAVEIGTNHTGKHYVEELSEEYKKQNILLRWIVLSDVDKQIEENQVGFLKRYLLNESSNKDLIVINKEGNIVTQYRMDIRKYIFYGRPIESDNYPKVYFETANLEDLILEDNEFKIKGFDELYSKWLSRKDKAFKKKCQAEIDKIERLKGYKQQGEQLKQKQQNKNDQNSLAEAERESPTINDKSYEACKAEILPRMNQTEEQVWDSNGRRWIKCRICGKIDTSDKFPSFGGPHALTLGICKECKKKDR